MQKPDYFTWVNCCDGPIRHGFGHTGKMPEIPDSMLAYQTESEEELLKHVPTWFDTRLKEHEYCPHYDPAENTVPYLQQIQYKRQRLERCAACPRLKERTGNVDQCQFYEEIENWLFWNGNPGEPGVKGEDYEETNEEATDKLIPEILGYDLSIFHQTARTELKKAREMRAISGKTYSIISSLLETWCEQLHLQGVHTLNIGD